MKLKRKPIQRKLEGGFVRRIMTSRWYLQSDDVLGSCDSIACEVEPGSTLTIRYHVPYSKRFIAREQHDGIREWLKGNGVKVLFHVTFDMRL